MKYALHCNECEELCLPLNNRGQRWHEIVLKDVERLSGLQADGYTFICLEGVQVPVSFLMTHYHHDVRVVSQEDE